MIDSAARLLFAPQESSICPDGRCAAAQEGGQDETGERSENRTDRGDDQAEDRQDEGEHSDGVGDVVVLFFITSYAGDAGKRKGRFAMRYRCRSPAPPSRSALIRPSLATSCFARLGRDRSKRIRLPVGVVRCLASSGT
jgi:hypothetical protein